MISISGKEYAPLAWTPTMDSPVIFDYDRMLAHASHLTGYVKIKLDVRAALELARLTPYPDGVKVGIMKQVANAGEITLEQTRIMLGWAARRAQHTGR